MTHEGSKKLILSFSDQKSKCKIVRKKLPSSNILLGLFNSYATSLSVITFILAELLPMPLFCLLVLFFCLFALLCFVFSMAVENLFGLLNSIAT